MGGALQKPNRHNRNIIFYVKTEVLGTEYGKAIYFKDGQVHPNHNNYLYKQPIIGTKDPSDITGLIKFLKQKK
jgi:hypothetical protein